LDICTWCPSPSSLLRAAAASALRREVPDKFEVLDKFEEVLDKFGQVWTSFGQVLDKFGAFNPYNMGAI
jgi:hypothetical protein